MHRAGRACHQLGTGGDGVSQRLGVPQVLTDQQANRDAVDLEHATATVRVDSEITALVKYRVIGQFALAVGLLQLAIAQHTGGVVDHAAVALRPANHCGDALHRGGDALDRRLAIGQEARPQQQVFGRVTAQGQLREQHQVGTEFLACGGNHLDDARAVAGNIAYREIELRQGNTQGIGHG